MVLKIRWKSFIVCLLIPLLTGGISALITMQSMRQYAALNLPSFSPPGTVFPIVWTILFILMGVSSYLIFESNSERRSCALTLYAVQLAVNFIWPILFFNANAYLFSFIWLILLWILILAMIIFFSKISKAAAYLQIPYLLWVTFAGFLNFAVYQLNP